MYDKSMQASINGMLNVVIQIVNLGLTTKRIRLVFRSRYLFFISLLFTDTDIPEADGLPIVYC